MGKGACSARFVRSQAELNARRREVTYEVAAYPTVLDLGGALRWRTGKKSKAAKKKKRRSTMTAGISHHAG